MGEALRNLTLLLMAGEARQGSAGRGRKALAAKMREAQEWAVGGWMRLKQQAEMCCVLI